MASRDRHELSAAMHNAVALTTRTCTDLELTQCGPEASIQLQYQIFFSQLEYVADRGDTYDYEMGEYGGHTDSLEGC